MQHISSFFADVCFFFFLSLCSSFLQHHSPICFFFFSSSFSFLLSWQRRKEGRQKWLRCLVNYSLVCVAEFSKIAQGLFVCLFVCGSSYAFLTWVAFLFGRFWQKWITHSNIHTHTETFLPKQEKALFSFLYAKNPLLLYKHSCTTQAHIYILIFFFF